MPNWCSTSYKITGPSETLNRINEAILHTDIQENSSPDWEGSVLRALGIQWKEYTHEDFNKPKGDYLRGFIQEPPSLSDNLLEFYAEEAWGLTDFGKVLERNIPGIKVYYMAEEPGMEIYVTNDEAGTYFPDRYYVDTCINGNYQSEYFTQKSSVYRWLSDLTNGKVKSAEDVEDFNSDYEDSDDFIYIHEFEITSYYD